MIVPQSHFNYVVEDGEQKWNIHSLFGLDLVRKNVLL